MIAVMVACTLAGLGLGWLFDAEAVGGFAGGFVGVVAAFWAVNRWYMKPLRDEWNTKDYSHLTPHNDDD